MSKLPAWRELATGAVIPKAGSSVEKKTAGWRTNRPIWHNEKCIQCLRCVRAVRSKDGRKVFASRGRTRHVTIEMDRDLAGHLSDEEARRAMDICPVGAILRKEVGFAVPIGKRKFDKRPIGSDIEEGPAR